MMGTVILSGALAGGLVGLALGYLIGLRDGIRRGRPTWTETNRQAVQAWQDGVAWGKYLDKHQKELGL